MRDDSAGPPKLRPFWGLALANTLSNITIPLASLTDVAVLGRLPEPAPLAAVALAGVIFDYLLWSLAFLRMGVTSETARAWGAGNGLQLRDTLRDHLILAAGFGLLMLACAPWILALGEYALTPATSLIGDLRGYFYARILGAPFALTNFVILGWLLGLGHSRAALVLAVLGNGLNAVLDIVLVLHWGQGAAGAGYATAAGQAAITVSGALYITHLFVQRRLPPAVPRRADANAHSRDQRHTRAAARVPGALLLRLGSTLRRLLRLLAFHRDLFVRTLVLITAFALLVRLSASMSVLALAATSLWLRVYSFVSFLSDGAAHALETYAGVLWACGEHAALRARVRQVLRVAFLISLVALLALSTAPTFWIGLLTTQAELTAPTLALLPGLLLTLLFGAPAWVYDGLFLGTGQARVLRNAMLFAFAAFASVAAIAYVQRSPLGLWFALAALMGGRSLALAYAWHVQARTAAGA